MRLVSLARALLPAPVAERLRDWRADRHAASDLAAYAMRPTIPPPHAFKVALVGDYARRHELRLLIETGTFEGEMARRCRHVFRQIVTIELDPELAERAARRLRRFPNIRVVQGDSASWLRKLLGEVSEPALFWLDGHYSGPGTARGASDTPLAAELQAIASHPVRGHVVLIDDARELGRGDYPALDAIERWMRAGNPSARVEVGDDIVRITPGGPEGHSGS